MRFFSKRIKKKCLGSWYVKGAEREDRSISRADSSVPLTHRDPRDLGLICLEEKRSPFPNLRIQSRISFKKHILNLELFSISRGRYLEQFFKDVLILSRMLRAYDVFSSFPPPLPPLLPSVLNSCCYCSQRFNIQTSWKAKVQCFVWTRWPRLYAFFKFLIKE